MSGKTHDVGAEHGNQAEKPIACVFREKSKQEKTNRKLIDTYRREKCVFGEEASRKTHCVCFLRKKQEKNTNLKFQVNFRVDLCIFTQIYINKKRTRHGNKECNI